MERRQTRRYRLIDLRSGRVWDFNSTFALVNMMSILTMWHPHAAVFVGERRYPYRLTGDVSEVAARIEAWANA